MNHRTPLFALLLATGCHTTTSASDAALDAVMDDAPLADAPANDVPAVSGDAGPTDAGPGVWHYESATTDLAPGEERANDCESWSLNNSETLYVNSVAFETSGGMHHSNWLFVPPSFFRGPDGRWDCTSRNYDEGIAAAAGGVLFAQSTQVTRETQQFRPGVVVPIPPYSRIVGGLHMLNATGAAVQNHFSLTLTTIPRDQVQTRLAGLLLQYNPLEIPPHTRADFTTQCDLATPHQHALGRPLDMKLYYALPHYHVLATGMRVDIVGGPHDGENMFQTMAALGEPWGRTLDPAVDLTGATGLRLTCSFNNTRDNTVHYGIGTNEMCVFFAFTDSTLQWATGAMDTQSGNVVTGTTDAGVLQNSAPCTVQTLPAHEGM